MFQNEYNNVTRTRQIRFNDGSLVFVLLELSARHRSLRPSDVFQEHNRREIPCILSCRVPITISMQPTQNTSSKMFFRIGTD